MKFVVSAGGRTYQVVVEGERVSIDGVPQDAHLGSLPGSPIRHLLLGERSFTLPIESLGRGQWQLSLNGEEWQVEVLDERAWHIRGLSGVAPKRGGGSLRAPMPGLVVRVLVGAGQTVAAGQGLVVLEAMKMENELRTGASGTVRAVRVHPGQAVEKGQLLLEFGDEPAA
jgi:pyruvate carboxylase subunit B